MTKLNDSKLKTLDEVKAFLSGSESIHFESAGGKAELYAWVQETLIRFHYLGLNKADRGVIRDYIHRVSGLSFSQLTRLIQRYRETGKVYLSSYKRQEIPKQYSMQDIRLLAKVDKLHHYLNGAAIKKICERAYEVFNEKEYERLSGISVSHLYNLRKTKTYLNQIVKYNKTKPAPVSIGIRKKPEPEGQPGFIRVDTVHQGDLDKVKGVYHINAVDEVTQFELICTVSKISEKYLVPVLEMMLEAFPFKIQGFHADNGGEYINKTVAKLLNKLFIELTKSRPKHSNDNALAETKNGSIVRKYYGYNHIPQRFSKKINAFNMGYLNPYLNFHRPCLFATYKPDRKGKIKKVYLYDDMNTPYEKLKSLPNAAQYLKENITFEQLDKIAYAMSDNEAAAQLNQKLTILFQEIHQEMKK